jgi:hypothetical protein
MSASPSIADNAESGLFDFERRRIPDDAWTRKRVMALFEKHRATPGAPYDARRFTDFLLAEPKARRSVFDGFRISRRLNAFIDDVQYEFAICFSLQDRRANDSLQKLVERVIELGSSRGRWPRSWRNQLAAGTEWASTVLANLVLLIGALWLRNQEWALGALGCAALFVNAWFARFAWRATAYFKRLQSRIEAVERVEVWLATRKAVRSEPAGVTAIGVWSKLPSGHGDWRRPTP